MGRIQELEEENRYLKKILDSIVEDVSSENIERVKLKVSSDCVYSYVVGNVQGSLLSYVDSKKGGYVDGRSEKRKQIRVSRMVTTVWLTWCADIFWAETRVRADCARADVRITPEALLVTYRLHL